MMAHTRMAAVFQRVFAEFFPFFLVGRMKVPSVFHVSSLPNTTGSKFFSLFPGNFPYFRIVSTLIRTHVHLGLPAMYGVLDLPEYYPDTFQGVRE